MPALKPGTPAPDFSLKVTPDQTVSLSDFRGRNVILVFYPADFSPVCSDELALYNELLPEIKEAKADIVGISVDGVWCHVAFSKSRSYRFPLLSDAYPQGAVARAYGVFREKESVTERALFLIDGEGIIRWSHVSPVGLNPGAEGLLEELEKLSSKPAPAR